MNFVLKPSLEHRALVKMAVSLWKQDDVGALIANFDYHCDFWTTNDKWQEVEEKVSGKVAQLPLPQLLKEKVSGCIRPVGVRILKWILFHCKQYNLPLNLPAELCWTAQGTVDRKRTAEVLVKDESLDISTRYKLACLYCLEEDVMAVWNTLSEDLRQLDCDRYPPIGFWSRTMERRGLDDAPISYKDAFKQCAVRGNKAAVEYFLQKLTPREREECLVETAKYVYDADTLCFLLSQMDEAQQMEVFKQDPGSVLNYFLQWPFQSFFMETAHCMWDYLSKFNYECILSDIIDKVGRGYKDCSYQELFREFWQKSPHALKSWITDDLDKSQLLPALCGIKDKENIRFILRFILPTPAAREKLIYGYKVHYFCQDWIRDDDWNSLEIFIRECFPSKDLMLKFKEHFKNLKKWDEVEDILVRNKDKWDKLFLSSDDSPREYEERSDDEGESRSSKRFRSLE